MPRDTEGYRIDQTWDVLGMRATRSDDTILEGVFVPDRYVVRVVPAGAAGIDAFVLGLFAWALIGFGNIYYGLARRALDLTIEAVKSKRSIAPDAPDGLPRGAAAPRRARWGWRSSRSARISIAWPTTGRTASITAPRGRPRSSRPSTTRSRTPGAIVDLALEVAGGFGIFRRSGLEQLFRDARLGRIHPANSMLTHEIVAKTLLGISPDETPRWG